MFYSSKTVCITFHQGLLSGLPIEIFQVNGHELDFTEELKYLDHLIHRSLNDDGDTGKGLVRSTLLSKPTFLEFPLFLLALIKFGCPYGPSNQKSLLLIKRVMCIFTRKK